VANLYKIIVEKNMKENDNLEDLRVDGSIRRKWVLKYRFDKVGCVCLTYQL